MGSDRGSGRDSSSSADFVPTAVERFGRKIKLEYFGMTSVYLIIGISIFGKAGWPQALICMAGAFLVFLSIKKKTRDHLSGSLLLFASALLARGAVLEAHWALSYLGFAACACAMEGYLGKRQEQSLALPLIFVLWSLVDISWLFALGFVAAYLLFPWTERPGLRKRTSWLVAISAILAMAVTILRTDLSLGLDAVWTMRLPLETDQRWMLLSLGLPTLLCLAAYWRRMLPTHRLNTIVFGLLAPFDQRWLAMFGMVAVITLSATAFRQSIDLDSIRPFFKHAEWFYFWLILGVAVWAVVTL